MFLKPAAWLDLDIRTHFGSWPGTWMVRERLNSNKGIGCRNMPGLIGSTNCGLWNPFFQYKAYGARRGVGGKAGHIPVHVPCWKTIGCLSSNFHGFCEMQLCRYIHVCHVLIHMQCLLVVQLALIHMQHLLVIHPALVQGELLHLVVLWFMIIDSSTQKQVWWFFFYMIYV